MNRREAIVYKGRGLFNNDLLTKAASDYCYLCHASHDHDGLICGSCHSDLPWNHHACESCALPLPSTSDSSFCAECLDSSSHVNKTLVPFLYDFPIDSLVKYMKYKDKIFISHFFSSSLINIVSTHYVDFPEVLLPVPLHSLRYRQRGYNQSTVLAKQVGKVLSIPVNEQVCRRVFNTQSQAGLNLKERQKNLRQAFDVKLNQPYDHVAIIDDVVTSGTTVQSVAKSLIKAGVKKVDVWACARAEL